MPNTERAARFRVLAREVFSWDAAIRWIALDEPGRQLQMEWRNGDIDSTPMAITPAHLTIDPLLLMLAESRDDIYSRRHGGDARHLRFVVLAYRDRAQIVTRFGSYGHLNLGLDLHGDAYEVGNRLVRLLDSTADPSVDATGNVALGQPRDVRVCAA